MLNVTGSLTFVLYYVCRQRANELDECERSLVSCRHLSLAEAKHFSFN